MPFAIFLAFLVSCVVTLWIVRSKVMHSYRFTDVETAGPQKFHSLPVPRIGSIGIIFGLVAGFAVVSRPGGEEFILSFWLLVCATPVFAGGITEDLTKKISVKTRLAAATISCVLGIWLLGALVTRSGIAGLDWIVSFEIGAVAITLLTVVGVSNAFNIIDGFNGLASMCAMMILLAVAYVAFQTHDELIGHWALLSWAAIFGFFVFNFPAGLIFLGDGGAYVVGFLVAELGILLVCRNSDVSPMSPLLMGIYPVFETLFSIYRKKILRGTSPGIPDGLHLHILIHRRFLRPLDAGSPEEVLRRNSMTSPFLWGLSTLAVVPGCIFWRNTAACCLFIGIFGMTYVYLYWRIVRFKTPRLLRKESR